jgi:hypothetical protein
MTKPGYLENAIDLAFGEAQVRAGFHIAEASEFAGGPIELEFFAETVGAGSCFLLVTGDRMRRRPGNFFFDAVFAGASLTDPFASVPDMGGPAGVVEIAAGCPWRQRLILNEFVRLEDTLGLLEPGASGQLVITCRRTLPLAADEQAALTPASDAPLVEVQLALDLRRDDTQLAALAKQLIAEVRDGPREKRERQLALLLSLRARIAVDRWRTLVNHPDPLVVERVKEALWSSGL